MTHHRNTIPIQHIGDEIGGTISSAERQDEIVDIVNQLTRIHVHYSRSHWNGLPGNPRRVTSVAVRSWVSSSASLLSHSKQPLMSFLLTYSITRLQFILGTRHNGVGKRHTRTSRTHLVGKPGGTQIIRGTE